MAAKDSESVSVKNLVKKSWEDQGGLKGLVVGLGVARVFEWMRNASASPDANSGLQSDIKGRGMVDEHIWLSSVAEAKLRVVEQGWINPDDDQPFTIRSVNKRASDLMQFVGTYSASDRAEIILMIGLNEKQVTEKIPTDKVDKDGNPIMKERTVSTNENGIRTIMLWLSMSNEEVGKELSAISFSSDRSRERRNNAARKYNNLIDTLAEAMGIEEE